MFFFFFFSSSSRPANPFGWDEAPPFFSPCRIDPRTERTCATQRDGGFVVVKAKKGRPSFLIAATGWRIDWADAIYISTVPFSLLELVSFSDRRLSIDLRFRPKEEKVEMRRLGLVTRHVTFYKQTSTRCGAPRYQTIDLKKKIFFSFRLNFSPSIGKKRKNMNQSLWLTARWRRPLPIDPRELFLFYCCDYYDDFFFGNEKENPSVGGCRRWSVRTP